jgi:hypothetical protein
MINIGQNTSYDRVTNPDHPLLTPSSITTFKVCPFLFNEVYLKGKRTPPRGAALQGTSVHAAVTYGANQVIATGTDAPLSDKKELAAATFEAKETETEFFTDENRGELKDQAVRLVELHHEQVAPLLKPIATELSVVVELSDHKRAGTIDIVEADDKLNELKTSKSRYGDVGDKIQGVFYPFLYERHYGRPAKEMNYDVLVKNKTPIAQRVSMPVDNGSQDFLEYEIQSVLQEMRLSAKTGIWRVAEEGHWRCAKSGKWCAFLSVCPKGKRI